MTCPACAERLTQEAAPLRGLWPTLRACTYGAGAAAVGAALYHAVIAITDFEIGLVAIAIGYLVGWSVRRGAGGRGGRRLQVAAVALTYVAVALAYAPFAMQGTAGVEDEAAASDSIRLEAALVPPAGMHVDENGLEELDAATMTTDAVVAGSVPASAETEPMNGFAAFGIVAAFVVVLPLFVILSSLPIGLVSALIIGVGMHRAWRMTGAPRLTVTGPFAIGGPPAEYPQQVAG